MNTRLAALAGSIAVVVGALGATTAAHAALVINPLFASSFTCPAGTCGISPASVLSLQGDLAAQGAINAAATQISSQFTNNVTANILFYGVHDGTGGFLAASLSGQTVYTISQFAGALGADAAAHPQNTVLNSAYANLGVGNGGNQPNALVVLNTTNARVLGLNAGVSAADSTAQFDATGNFIGGGGVVDGVVLLNLDQPLAFSRPVPGFSNPPGSIYDAQSAMEHEIDEVMGIGGAGSQLNSFNADPNYAQDDFGVSGPLYGVMDLFRYQAPGTPSFDPSGVSVTGCANLSICTGLDSPYFSVDGGVTPIDEFNQAFPFLGGDAGDWGLNLFQACANGGVGGAGDVQDAFSCSNQSPDVARGTPSYLSFEAIGYNPVPEPAVWTLMIGGLGLMGAALRRRRAAVA